MKKVLNQLKAGSIISYIQMFLSIGIGLVYTPVMLRLIGQSEFGLYSTVASTISMISILSLGFNSGYVKYYAKYKISDDKESIYKLNGLFLIIFSIIGFIALICGLFLAFNLQLVFDKGLTTAEYEVAKILMLLLTVNLTVSFPASVFQNIISATERFVFLKLLGVIKTVVSPLLTLPLLLAGYGSIGMVTVTVAISLSIDICYYIYVKNVLKNKFYFRDFERGLLKSLFAFTAFIAVNIVIDQINWNIDKLILGRYKGTIAVAVYTVGYNLFTYYQMFSTSISGVFTPRIHKIFNKYNYDSNKLTTELTSLFIKVGRIQFLVLGLVASGVCLFGKTFIRIWAGDGYEESYYVALLLIIPASVALVQNLGIEIQRAANKHQYRSIVYAFMAIFNLIASIILCQKYGAVGGALGTALSLIIANGFIMNIYYHKKCYLNILYFWKNILRMSLGLIIPLTFGLVINYYMKYTSVLKLLVGIVLYAIVYCFSMWFIGMNSYEKDLVRKPISKLLKKA